MKVLELLTEDKSRKIQKLKVGQVYMNDKRHEVDIEFLDGDTVGYVLLKGGKRLGKEDESTKELLAFLNDNGYKLDHTQTW